MKKILREIIHSKIANFILLLILFIIVIQMYIISITISGQSNYFGKINDYDTVKKGNIALIHFINGLKKTASVDLFYKYVRSLNEANIQLDNSNVSISITKAPKCKRITYSITTNLTTDLKSNSYGYCFSAKMYNGDWFNYKVFPQIGVYEIVTFLSLVTLALMAIIGVYAWVIMKVYLPLKIFQISALNLGMRLKNEPIKIKGLNVIQDISKTLNFMQAKLFSTLKLRTKILATISHDLRAPITRLKMRMQMGDHASYKNLEDVIELEAMIDSILIFAKEDTFLKEDIKKLDLYSLLEIIVYEYCDLGKNVNFANTENKVTIIGRPLALKRAFTNIISNSVKYATRTEISIYKEDKWVVISVKDNGDGIDSVDLEKVFDPFYKSKNSASGTGLGLSIAHEIIKNHNGEIILRNLHKGGLDVQIKLPL